MEPPVRSVPTSSDSKLKAELTSRSELFGENLTPTDLDPEKLKEALKKQQEFQKGKVRVWIVYVAVQKNQIG